jgi:hypothetical protein
VVDHTVRVVLLFVFVEYLLLYYHVVMKTLWFMLLSRDDIGSGGCRVFGGCDMMPRDVKSVLVEVGEGTLLSQAKSIICQHSSRFLSGNRRFSCT